MKNLKQARETTGTRQADLAILLGVAPPLISVYENGRATPPLEDCLQIEHFFGEPIDWPDTLTVTDRLEVMHGLTALAARYPLNTVLDFAKRALKIDSDLDSPAGTVILHALHKASQVDTELLPPTGIEFTDNTTK